MPWFKVDDGFYDHPKVIGLDMNAIGLWALAGSYCARHLTDGVITDRQIRAIGGTRRQAEKLVSAGLWTVDDAPVNARRYFFNDWRDFQPSRGETLRKREEDAERKRKARAAKAAKQGQRENVRSDVHVDVQPESALPGVHAPSALPDPTRPDPTPSIGYVGEGSHVGERARENLPPSPHCTKHPGGTTAPCRACGDARRAVEEFEAQRLLTAKQVRSEQARSAAELRAAAIANCDLCDDDGYRAGLPCDHDPESEERARRGIALVRETLAKRGVA